MLSEYARHPKLTALCERLASMSALTEREALTIVEAAAAQLGVTRLDIEMCQPGASTDIPFAAVRVAGERGEYADSVSHHVQMLIAGRRA